MSTREMREVLIRLRPKSKNIAVIHKLYEMERSQQQCPTLLATSAPEIRDFYNRIDKEEASRNATMFHEGGASQQKSCSSSLGAVP